MPNSGGMLPVSWLSGIESSSPDSAVNELPSQTCALWDLLPELRVGRGSDSRSPDCRARRCLEDSSRRVPRNSGGMLPVSWFTGDKRFLERVRRTSRSPIEGPGEACLTPGDAGPRQLVFEDREPQMPPGWRAALESSMESSETNRPGALPGGDPHPSVGFQGEPQMRSIRLARRRPNSGGMLPSPSVGFRRRRPIVSQILRRQLARLPNSEGIAQLRGDAPRVGFWRATDA